MKVHCYKSINRITKQEEEFSGLFGSRKNARKWYLEHGKKFEEKGIPLAYRVINGKPTKKE